MLTVPTIRENTNRGPNRQKTYLSISWNSYQQELNRTQYSNTAAHYERRNE